MPESLAKLAGLTERDRKQLLEAHEKLTNALRVAQASAKCGIECQELLTDIHSLLNQTTTMLQEFFGSDPEG